MDEPADPRERLAFYYRLLRRYGLNDSHSGNASLRDGDRVWVTPTGACADTLQPADLIECRLGNTPPEGASLDVPLHLAVYRTNPQAQAVLHSHGPYSVAMTLDGSQFDPVDFEGQYYFGRIPVIDIPYADYLSEAPAAVAEVLKAHKVTVVRGHGVYAQGESLNRAYKWTASFELSAKTAWLARMIQSG
jgi:L-fuculose-phosphate aldolase